MEARADLGDVIIGTALGAIIAGSQKGGGRGGRGYVRTDADIQRALNYYGCDAGRPDGVLGPRTKRAIQCFQAQLGEPQTGVLTAAQTSTLYSSYARDTSNAFNRAGSGTGNVNAPSNANYDNLLVSLGSQTTSPAVIGGNFAGGTPTSLGTEALTASPTVPVPVQDQPFCAALPQKQTSGNLVSSTDVDAVVDSYCAALGYADLQTRDLLGAANGFNAEQAEAVCKQFVGSNGARITSALALPAQDAVQTLRQILPNAVGNQATLNNFIICNGIASLANDKEGMHAFSAMVAAYGGEGYGELVAAHYALGLGVPQNTQLASDWYLWAAEALEGGGSPLIVSGDYNHIPLLAALSQSALAVTTNWQGYLAQTSQPAVGTGGFSLPGLGGSTLQPAAALPADFETRYGMSGEAALQACRERSNAMFTLGLEGCRLVAQAYQDAELMAQFK
jgi:hypothetical protein